MEFVTGTLAGRKVVLFLSGVSMVNAAMTSQLAFERFDITGIVASGVADGVDPGLRIGDVAVAGRRGQYLEAMIVGEIDARGGKETRFWFKADPGMLAAASGIGSVELKRRTAEQACLSGVPFIAFRSLSDLAGGDELRTFFQLASYNSAAVVKRFLTLWTPPRWCEPGRVDIRQSKP